MKVDKNKVAIFIIIMIGIVFAIYVVYNIGDIFYVAETNIGASYGYDYEAELEEAYEMLDEVADYNDTFYAEVLAEGPRNEYYSEAIEWFKFEGYTDEEIDEIIYELSQNKDVYSF